MTGGRGGDRTPVSFALCGEITSVGEAVCTLLLHGDVAMQCSSKVFMLGQGVGQREFPESCFLTFMASGPRKASVTTTRRGCNKSRPIQKNRLSQAQQGRQQSTEKRVQRVRPIQGVPGMCRNYFFSGQIGDGTGTSFGEVNGRRAKRQITRGQFGSDASKKNVLLLARLHAHDA